MKDGLWLLSLSFLCLFCRGARAEDPEAWRIATDRKAGAAALEDYRNNVVRARWAGDAKGLAAAYPVNVGYCLPVAGSEQSVSNVQRILDATVAAMSPQARSNLIARKHLAPVVEWLVRTTRPGVTNDTAYLDYRNLTSVFTEADFVESSLTNLAARIGANFELPIVTLSMCGEYRGRKKIPSAEPVLDYPDFRPEITFSAPNLHAQTLRAPEAQREFRFRAKTQFAASVPMTYKWIGPFWLRSWNDSREHRPEKGFAHVPINRTYLRSRTDLYVVARYQGGFWGPPAVISFYGSPFETRVYSKDRLLTSTRFDEKYKPPVPYSFASIRLPYDWTDFYQYDDRLKFLGYERSVSTYPGKVMFSNRGEIVVETHSNDTPKTTRRVRYFEKDGQLAYEEEGEEIHYKYNESTARRE